MSNLQHTQGEFLCNVTLLAIVLKFNAFRRILACSYSTLRLSKEGADLFSMLLGDVTASSACLALDSEGDGEGRLTKTGTYATY